MSFSVKLHPREGEEYAEGGLMAALFDFWNVSGELMSRHFISLLTLRRRARYSAHQRSSREGKKT
jgi:hypothetical protein